MVFTSAKKGRNKKSFMSSAKMGIPNFRRLKFSAPAGCSEKFSGLVWLGGRGPWEVEQEASGGLQHMYACSTCMVSSVSAFQQSKKIYFSSLLKGQFCSCVFLCTNANLPLIAYRKNYSPRCGKHTVTPHPHVWTPGAHQWLKYLPTWTKITGTSARRRTLRRLFIATNC